MRYHVQVTIKVIQYCVKETVIYYLYELKKKKKEVVAKLCLILISDAAVEHIGHRFSITIYKQSTSLHFICRFVCDKYVYAYDMNNKNISKEKTIYRSLG